MQLVLAGQVVGCTGLSAGSASCRWRLVASEQWRLVAGPEGWQTSQSDCPSEPGGLFVFNHPVEACFEADGQPAEHEWPHIEIEVRSRDEYQRSDVGGYAVVHVPNSPGMHELASSLWRPQSSMLQSVAAFFYGGRAPPKDETLIYGIGQGAEGAKTQRLERGMGRQRLNTVPCGRIHLNIGTCIRVSDSNASR